MKRRRILYKQEKEPGHSGPDCNLVLNIEQVGDNNKFELFSEAEIFEDFDPSDNINEAIAALGLREKQNDLMYVKFKLVHAGVNKNLDHFLADELKQAAKTPILKLLNWGHSEPSIGVIYKSIYRDGVNGESDYLECYAAISKYKYKKQAEEILARYKLNNLYFSMETWFKEAECSYCHGIFEDEEQYCSHLKNRFYNTGKVSRILHTLNFAGAAVVVNPADINAEALALASEYTDNSNKEENIVSVNANEIVTETVENIVTETNNEEVENNIAESTETSTETSVEEVPEVTESVEQVEAEDVDIIKNIKAELEDTRTRLNTISEKYDVLAVEKDEITQRLNVLLQEYESYKNDVVASRLLDSRIDELNKIGFNFPGNEEEKNVILAHLKSIDDNTFTILKSLFNNKSIASVNAINSTEENIVEAESDSSDKIDVVNLDDADIPITSTNDINAKDNQILAIKQTIKNILS